jgi:acyl carrier protein
LNAPPSGPAKKKENSFMSTQERLKRILVVELNLEDFTPEEIDDDEPIFGGRFDLDSIDALEIVYQVEQHFGIPMKEMNDARDAFASVNTLAAFIDARLQG